jgi:hypothetical protein
MPGSTSFDLFNLAKSLSPMEKRYIKIYIGRQEGGKSGGATTLFDAISKQKKYDEKKLQDKLKHLPHFPILKNRLYKTILNGLESYHSENSVDAKLRSRMNQAEVLFNKGLEDQCSKLLIRTKKIAAENEKWQQLLDVLDWEWRLTSTYYKSAHMEAKQSSNLAETRIVLAKLKNYYEYQIFKKELLNIDQKEDAIKKSIEVKKMNRLLAQPLLTNEKNALSTKAKMSYYGVLTRLSLLKKEPGKSFIYAKKNVELSKPKEKTQLVNIISYFYAVEQYTVCCFMLNKFKDAEEAIEEIRNIPYNYNIKDSAFFLSRILVTSTGLSFSLYLNTGQFEKALVLTKEIEKNQDKYQKNILGSNKILMQYYLFYTYFGVNNYKKAFKYLNETIRMSEDSGLRNDMYVLSQLLSVIVQYELGYHDQLPYVIASVQRQLTKQKEIRKFEKLLFDFIRKRAAGKIPVNQIPVFVKLKEELAAALKRHPRKKVFESFDFISWIDSKIENKSFAAIVHEKALRRSL